MPRAFTNGDFEPPRAIKCAQREETNNKNAKKKRDNNAFLWAKAHSTPRPYASYFGTCKKSRQKCQASIHRLIHLHLPVRRSALLEVLFRRQATTDMGALSLFFSLLLFRRRFRSVPVRFVRGLAPLALFVCASPIYPTPPTRARSHGRKKDGAPAKRGETGGVGTQTIVIVCAADQKRKEVAAYAHAAP